MLGNACKERVVAAALRQLPRIQPSNWCIETCAAGWQLQQSRSYAMQLLEIFSKKSREERKRKVQEDMSRGYFDDFKEMRDTRGKMFQAATHLTVASVAPRFPQLQATRPDGSTIPFPPQPGSPTSFQAALVCIAFRAGAEDMLSAWSGPFRSTFASRAGPAQHFELSLVESRVMGLWPFRAMILRGARNSQSPPAPPQPAGPARDAIDDRAAAERPLAYAAVEDKLGESYKAVGAWGHGPDAPGVVAGIGAGSRSGRPGVTGADDPRDGGDGASPRASPGTGGVGGASAGAEQEPGPRSSTEGRGAGGEGGGSSPSGRRGAEKWQASSGAAAGQLGSRNVAAVAGGISTGGGGSSVGNGGAAGGKSGIVPQYLFHFGNADELRRVLGMTNRLTGYVYLLDGAGRVRWRGSGAPDRSELDSLLACSERLLERESKGT